MLTFVPSLNEQNTLLLLTKLIKVQSKHISFSGKENLSKAFSPYSEVLHLTAIVPSAQV